MTDSIQIVMANARIDSLQYVIHNHKIEIAEKTKQLELIVNDYNISESYFTCILSSQLAIFTVIIGLAGLISWKTISATFASQMKRTQEKMDQKIQEVNSDLSKFKAEIQSEQDIFKEDYLQLSAKTSTALHFTLTQAAPVLSKVNSFSFIYINALIISSILDHDHSKDQDVQILTYLNDINEFLERPNIVSINHDQMSIIKHSLERLKNHENPHITKSLGHALVELDKLEKKYLS